MEEQAALLEVLEPSGAPLWARVSDVDGWALRASARAIAHDLREPIVGIRRLAEWLSDLASAEDKHDADRYRELLHTRLDRLESRYDALRRFVESGLVSGEPEPVFIDRLLTDAANAAASRVGRQLDLVLELERTEILAPKAPLDRCLTELIANAAVHHDGERVTLRVGTTLTSGAWMFSFADDGPGVAEHHRERVFEPFFALDPARGVGMGLAIVRRTAALRGGWCELAEHEHRGTDAVLTWPLS